jgi:hypothetical protein
MKTLVVLILLLSAPIGLADPERPTDPGLNSTSSSAEAGTES